jgi:hypothetical protein
MTQAVQDGLPRQTAIDPVLALRPPCPPDETRCGIVIEEPEPPRLHAPLDAPAEIILQFLEAETDDAVPLIETVVEGARQRLEAAQDLQEHPHHPPGSESPGTRWTFFFLSAQSQESIGPHFGSKVGSAPGLPITAGPPLLAACLRWLLPVVSDAAAGRKRSPPGGWGCTVGWGRRVGRPSRHGGAPRRRC